MKLRHLTLLLCVSLSLTGCSALLERNYATVEPHSSKFWESEAAGTLRAENYQDIVNDLLILIGQHTESATVRLYNYEDDPAGPSGGTMRSASRSATAGRRSRSRRW